MAFQGQSGCAVPKCNGPCSVGANLCEDHLVPGMVIKHGSSTVVVTAWYAEHANEGGVIVLNEYALGDLFGGASGFQANLEKQGFGEVRNLRTPEEFEAARAQAAKSPGNWSGPW